MFDDQVRTNLYESFKTEKGVKKWFAKNREKFQKDVEKERKSYEEIKNGSFEDEHSKLLGQLITLSSQKTLEMISDILDLLEISFLHRLETREELRDLVFIVQEKDSEIEELNELKKKLEKHEPSLEWIDKYFEHSSETTDD